jgi:hypothetical protein
VVCRSEGARGKRPFYKCFMCRRPISLSIVFALPRLPRSTAAPNRVPTHRPVTAGASSLTSDDQFAQMEASSVPTGSAPAPPSPSSVPNANANANPVPAPAATSPGHVLGHADHQMKRPQDAAIVTPGDLHEEKEKGGGTGTGPHPHPHSHPAAPSHPHHGAGLTGAGGNVAMGLRKDGRS